MLRKTRPEMQLCPLPKLSAPFKMMVFALSLDKNNSYIRSVRIVFMSWVLFDVLDPSQLHDLSLIILGNTADCVIPF
jgi:hypothetical protein